MTEIGLAITRALERALSDPEPRAFERVFKRVSDDVDKAQNLAMMKRDARGDAIEQAGDERKL